ncbi:MAG TPA: hypothetical protein VNQ90_04035 [Chthoniobacteraceae bacterium]|nr:hypothetical protein [Chthoniobacteraceae bacterium]
MMKSLFHGHLAVFCVVAWAAVGWMPRPAAAEVLLFGFETSEGYTGANGSSIANQGGWEGGGTTFTLDTTGGYQSQQSLRSSGGTGRADSPTLYSHDLDGISLYFTNPDAYPEANVHLMRFRLQTGVPGDEDDLRRLEFHITYTSDPSVLSLQYNIHSATATDKRGNAAVTFSASLLDLDDWNQFRFQADFDHAGGPVYSVFLNNVQILEDIAIYDTGEADAAMRLFRLQFWAHHNGTVSAAGAVSYDRIVGYAVVPEPSVAGLVLGAGVLVMMFRHRSRRV